MHLVGALISGSHGPFSGYRTPQPCLGVERARYPPEPHQTSDLPGLGRVCCCGAGRTGSVAGRTGSIPTASTVHRLSAPVLPTVPWSLNIGQSLHLWMPWFPAPFTSGEPWGSKMPCSLPPHPPAFLPCPATAPWLQPVLPLASGQLGHSGGVRG